MPHSWYGAASGKHVWLFRDDGHARLMAQKLAANHRARYGRACEHYVGQVTEDLREILDDHIFLEVTDPCVDP